MKEKVQEIKENKQKKGEESHMGSQGMDEQNKGYQESRRCL